jgi:hypothetical protein
MIGCGVCRIFDPAGYYLRITDRPGDDTAE